MYVLRASVREMQKLEALRTLAHRGTTEHERAVAQRLADKLEAKLSSRTLDPVPEPAPRGSAFVHPPRCFMPWCPHCEVIRAQRRRRFQ